MCHPMIRKHFFVKIKIQWVHDSALPCFAEHKHQICFLMLSPSFILLFWEVSEGPVKPLPSVYQGGTFFRFCNEFT